MAQAAPGPALFPAAFLTGSPELWGAGPPEREGANAQCGQAGDPTRRIDRGRLSPASAGIFQDVLLSLKKGRSNSKGPYGAPEISQEENNYPSYSSRFPLSGGCVFSPRGHGGSASPALHGRLSHAGAPTWHSLHARAASVLGVCLARAPRPWALSCHLISAPSSPEQAGVPAQCASGPGHRTVWAGPAVLASQHPSTSVH